MALGRTNESTFGSQASSSSWCSRQITPSLISPITARAGCVDSLSMLQAEGPVPQRWQFLAEKRIRIRDGLLEGAGNSLFQRDSIAWPADSAHKGLYCPCLISGAVLLQGRGYECSRRSSGAGNLIECGLQQSQRAHRPWSIQGQLESHIRAVRVANDMRRLNSEPAHE